MEGYSMSDDYTTGADSGISAPGGTAEVTELGEQDPNQTAKDGADFATSIVNAVYRLAEIVQRHADPSGDDFAGCEVVKSEMTRVEKLIPRVM